MNSIKRYLFLLILTVVAGILCFMMFRKYIIVNENTLFVKTLQALPPLKTSLQQRPSSRALKKQEKGENTTLPQKPNYDHILVDDKHKMLLCQIPKIACSNWRRVFLVLTGHIKEADMMHTQPHQPYYRSLLPTLNRFNFSSIHYRLQYYYKVMFVRDPLERLLSTWRNKFQAGNDIFFTKNLAAIFPEDKCSKGTKSQTDMADKWKIPFQRFLECIIYSFATSGKMNEHWQRYHKVCFPAPCTTILWEKYETLKTDAARVLKSVNAADEVHFPERYLNYKHKKTSLFTDQYYNKVSLSVLKQLYSLYETDFLLFNYTAPDSFKH